MISASSKQRTTWKMASTARMCDKKAFPRPAPVEAPRVKPAISYMVRWAGTRDLGLYFSQSQSYLSSGTITRDSSGSMVAKGKFYKGQLCSTEWNVGAYGRVSKGALGDSLEESRLSHVCKSDLKIVRPASNI